MSRNWKMNVNGGEGWSKISGLDPMLNNVSALSCDWEMKRKLKVVPTKWRHLGRAFWIFWKARAKWRHPTSIPSMRRIWKVLRRDFRLVGFNCVWIPLAISGETVPTPSEMRFVVLSTDDCIHKFVLMFESFKKPDCTFLQSRLRIAKESRPSPCHC